MPTKRGVFLSLGAITVALGLSIASPACRENDPEPFVVLFCLDGASSEVIDDLRSQGRVPTFDRLIRSGAYGPLQSWAARKIMSVNPRRGFHSPIVWATVATGKIPEKHGIRDFILPIRGTSSVWMGSDDEPGRAELSFPELRGKGPYVLHIRLHSFGANGEQPVQLLLNEEPLERIQVPVEWADFSIRLSDDLLRPARNQLGLIFSRQSRPAEGRSTDRRRLACELKSLRITDADGNTVYELDPVYHRSSLGRGFYPPQASVTEVQSVHWRAQPLWNILGGLRKPVGIIGYWGTWPAYEVDGFLVSSRMGIAEHRKGSERLTWPPELASNLESLVPQIEELKEYFARLHVSECDPPLLDEKSVLKKIVIQDEFYSRIARELLPSMDKGFFSVYFRSIDVASHVSLQWRHGADLPDGCPESVRSVVDEVYVQIDEWMGELLALLPDHAAVFVVSDHAMQPSDYAGRHAPFGIFLASGRNVRRDVHLDGASVLDIAPTILHLFGAPIPLDMDGKVLPQVFDTRWLTDHPPRYADMDTSLSVEEDALTEGRDEILEELRALGYIQ